MPLYPESTVFHSGYKTIDFFKTYDVIDICFLMHIHLFLECGKSKSNFIYGDGKTYLDASTGSCTSIRISDRFVLTAAQCMEQL